MAEETSNPGYQDAETYATNPTGNAPDSTYQEYERGLNSYNLARAGETALLNATVDIESGAPTPSATIDSSGNLLVGKTVADTSVAGHQLEPSGKANFTRDGGSPASFNRLTDDGTLVEFRQDNSIEGAISITGTTTTYGTTSDYRLKENVVPMSSATDRLKLLKPSRFNFIKKPDRTVDGFIAHEVAEVVPEAVVGAKDATKVSEETGETVPAYQNIDESKLVPLLVATIQELEARITALEA